MGAEKGNGGGEGGNGGEETGVGKEGRRQARGGTVDMRVILNESNKDENATNIVGLKGNY